MVEKDFEELIKGCIKQNRRSQKALYTHYYGFAMSKCLRYADNRNEAAEILNQGFLTIFNNLEKKGILLPIEPMIGNIMVNTSIDYYHTTLKVAYANDIDNILEIGDDILESREMHYHQFLNVLQQLPRSCRTVFNLFAIDEYSHEEIAYLLNIDIETSKSDLWRARQRLKAMMLDKAHFVKSYAPDCK